jgi:hypothetical protein
VRVPFLPRCLPDAPLKIGTQRPDACQRLDARTRDRFSALDGASRPNHHVDIPGSLCRRLGYLGAHACNHSFRNLGDDLVSDNAARLDGLYNCGLAIMQELNDPSADEPLKLAEIDGDGTVLRSQFDIRLPLETLQQGATIDRWALLGIDRLPSLQRCRRRV